MKIRHRNSNVQDNIYNSINFGNMNRKYMNKYNVNGNSDIIQFYPFNNNSIYYINNKSKKKYNSSTEESEQLNFKSNNISKKYSVNSIKEKILSEIKKQSTSHNFQSSQKKLHKRQSQIINIKYTKKEHLSNYGSIQKYDRIYVNNNNLDRTYLPNLIENNNTYKERYQAHTLQYQSFWGSFISSDSTKLSNENKKSQKINLNEFNIDKLIEIGEKYFNKQKPLSSLGSIFNKKLLFPNKKTKNIFNKIPTPSKKCTSVERRASQGIKKRLSRSRLTKKAKLVEGKIFITRLNNCNQIHSKKLKDIKKNNSMINIRYESGEKLVKNKENVEPNANMRKRSKEHKIILDKKIEEKVSKDKKNNNDIGKRVKLFGYDDRHNLEEGSLSNHSYFESKQLKNFLSCKHSFRKKILIN